MAFAFDYNGTGNLDHIVLYRPGTGVVYIEEKQISGYVPVYQSLSGIGGYDLKSSADRIIAFDYSGTGHADHLLCYRPGTGILWILENNDGNFSPVFTSSEGIGGFDVRSPADKIIAFDYDGTGKYDHLVLYRPGTGIVYIVQNTSGTFSAEFKSTGGIGGYDLKSSNDEIIAFDYYSVGIGDYLLAYRPGSGVAYVLENVNGSGTFSAVQTSATGIGGYDLRSPSDRLVAYDYLQIGNQDHLVAYRPGAGDFYIIQQAYFADSAVFSSGVGAGGYDFRSALDQVFAFDYNSTGILGTLAFYRPGSGDFYIEGNEDGTLVKQARRANEPQF